MRFTRAAKVAAFPLLAMVLVVALIACQAGPAGKDGTAKGRQGTTRPVTGRRRWHTLQAKAMATVIFNNAVVQVDGRRQHQLVGIHSDGCGCDRSEHGVHRRSRRRPRVPD